VIVRGKLAEYHQATMYGSATKAVASTRSQNIAIPRNLFVMVSPPPVTWSLEGLDPKLSRLV
jgi:hypothetical protein